MRLFSSYWEAELHGYYSVTHLGQMGLFVPDSVRPYYECLVETRRGNLPVYSIKQCATVSQVGSESQASKESLTENGAVDQEADLRSTSTEPQPCSPSPFDVQNALKSSAGNEIPPKSRLERSKGSGASCTAYFPEDFQAHDWATIQGMEDEAAVVFDQLYKFRHVHGQGKDEYVSLSWAYGRELVGQRKFDRLMKILLDAKILERTDIKEDPYGLGAWVPRGKGTSIAFGYRFVNPDYRRNYSKVIVGSKALERRLKRLRDNVRYPVQKHLRRLLEEITAVMPEDAELLAVAEDDRPKADAVKEQLRAVREGERFFSVDRSTRRIYSNLTSLKRGARRFLRVRGEPLWQLDLPCCHLLALAHKCLEAGVQDAEEFLHYCERDFYQQLADEGGFTREEVKEAFTRRALNAPNHHPYQRSTVMRFFQKRWKHVARFMYRYKANGKPTRDCPKPHNKLALALQKWEADLVIFHVCDRIRRDRPECWIATIHDAVACLERDVPFVVEVVEQELKSLGITLAPGKLAGKPM